MCCCCCTSCPFSLYIDDMLYLCVVHGENYSDFIDVVCFENKKKCDRNVIAIYVSKCLFINTQKKSVLRNVKYNLI